MVEGINQFSISSQALLALWLFVYKRRTFLFPLSSLYSHIYSICSICLKKEFHFNSKGLRPKQRRSRKCNRVPHQTDWLPLTALSMSSSHASKSPCSTRRSCRWVSMGCSSAIRVFFCSDSKASVQLCWRKCLRQRRMASCSLYCRDTTYRKEVQINGSRVSSPNQESVYKTLINRSVKQAILPQFKLSQPHSFFNLWHYNDDKMQSRLESILMV